MEQYNLYKDIQARTNGEIYLGVVGAVRTGKSTFIKRFMEQMVIPHIEDENVRARTRDELPQSAQGKTIMTTEPKFIPKDAAQIRLTDDAGVKVRLIDCVGYMVEGASGHLENGVERMVKTPWSEQEIPFSQAAETGTRKVIKDHATIGIVVTTDGSVTEIPAANYQKPTQETVNELKKSGKPFLILLNSAKPYSEEVRQMAQQMEMQYGVSVIPVNCEQLRSEDVNHILERILYEFPVVRMNFYLPKWVDLLGQDRPVKKNVIENARKILQEITYVKDIWNYEFRPDGEYLEKMKLEQMNLSDGTAEIRMEVAQKYYYENISELTGVDVHGEYELIQLIREMSAKKKEYDKVADAMQSVRMKGYGVVSPQLSDIALDEPEVIKHGSQFGVKIKASSPSIHMIRANIETEIAPIVGSEEQAQGLKQYIKEGQNSQEGVWNTNIFGKTIGELMEDGISHKISMMDDESQMKLQDTMQKIVNDSNGGMVCIII
ncbi:MAG: stage IV sporulation protein A [Eubacterium sp.]|nr:stage IV sporulation protein A [Eubacterium sp.]MCI8919396.1 stage IV sporulation protein A [Eubacterium sp.]